MGRRIMALLSVLALAIAGALAFAPSASASTSPESDYFNYDITYSPPRVGVNKHWWRAQDVITVSDRSGYDMNENEATYAWSSLTGDGLQMAYTGYQTCTWCIRVLDAPATDPNVNYAPWTTRQYTEVVNNEVVSKQCTIRVNRDWLATHGLASSRQAAMTNAIGQCIGFETFQGQYADGFTVMQYPLTRVTPGPTDYGLLKENYLPNV